MDPFITRYQPLLHETTVLIDFMKSSVLQPHQREGILFMYNCVMGNNGAGTGCILDDEMYMSSLPPKWLRDSRALFSIAGD